MLTFATYPLWLNLLLFATAAAFVWMAGSRLAALADSLAEQTGLGAAFVGALILGGITSLPEAATTVSASVLGNAPLAVNNVFGGIALQVAVLAAADLVKPGPALTADVRRPDVLLQGVLLVFVLAIAATGITFGDTLVLGVGLWTSAVFAAAVGAFFLMHDYGRRPTWLPVGRPDPAPRAQIVRAADDRALGRLVVPLLGAAAVVVAAGYVLARVGDVLADQTALGSGFVGVVLLAIATSLPEVSTTLAAARLGAYSLAISNIFGANILDAAILLLADAVYPGPPVLNEAGPIAGFSALLGIILTSTFLIGLLLRRKRVVLGVGIDSLVVVALYLGGVALLYTLR